MAFPRCVPYRVALAAIALTIACSPQKPSKKKSEDDETVAPVSGADSAVAKSPDSKGRTPIRLPGVTEPAPWLSDARHLAVLGGGGPTSIVAAGGTGWVRWFNPKGTKLGEVEVEGAVQVLESGDVDGDGTEELLVASGMGVGARGAPLRVQVVFLSRPEARELLPTAQTDRQQAVAVQVDPSQSGRLWVANFVSKFEVDVSAYRRSETGAWKQVDERGRHRVVGDLAVLSDGTPVIARFYGAHKDAPGGVYELPQGEEPVAIPSTRGARAVLALPGDAVAMADGWHREYGEKAEGLVTLATKGEGRSWSKTKGVKVAGSYGYAKLRTADVHRQPGVEIIASGNGPAIVVIPSRPDLLFQLSDVEAWDAVGLQNSPSAREQVVIAGPSPVIWTAR